MQELITRIEKIEPHPTEAIVLFYNPNDINLAGVSSIWKALSNKFSENTVIALPDNMSLGSCSKDVLENIISQISEIIESL